MNLKVTGNFTDKIFDKDMNLLRVIEAHNMVTEVLTTLVAELLKGDITGGTFYW